MSSHLYPEVSAHLLATTPTAHWLEYVDWAAPILEQPLAIEDGHAVVPDRAGNGLAWDAAAVRRAVADVETSAVASADMPSTVARIVARPGATPVSIPVVETCAIVGSSDIHVTGRF